MRVSLSDKPLLQRLQRGVCKREPTQICIATRSKHESTAIEKQNFYYTKYTTFTFSDLFFFITQSYDLISATFIPRKPQRVLSPQKQNQKKRQIFTTLTRPHLYPNTNLYSATKIQASNFYTMTRKHHYHTIELSSTHLFVL